MFLITSFCYRYINIFNLFCSRRNNLSVAPDGFVVEKNAHVVYISIKSYTGNAMKKYHIRGNQETNINTYSYTLI